MRRVYTPNLEPYDEELNSNYGLPVVNEEYEDEDDIVDENIPNEYEEELPEEDIAIRHFECIHNLSNVLNSGFESRQLRYSDLNYANYVRIRGANNKECDYSHPEISAFEQFVSEYESDDFIVSVDLDNYRYRCHPDLDEQNQPELGNISGKHGGAHTPGLTPALRSAPAPFSVTKSSSLSPYKRQSMAGDMQIEGLSASEAMQRLLTNGRNDFEIESVQLPKWVIMIRSFLKNKFFFCTISLCLLVWTSNYLSFLILLFLLIVSTSYFTMHEVNANSNIERITNELNKILPFKCIVKRDGKWFFMNSLLLVPGDIVLLTRPGELCPADCVVIKTNWNISVNVDRKRATEDGEAGVVELGDIPGEEHLVDEINCLDEAAKFEQNLYSNECSLLSVHPGELVLTGCLLISGRNVLLKVMSTGKKSYVGTILHDIKAVKSTKVTLLQRYIRNSSNALLLVLFMILIGTVLGVVYIDYRHKNEDEDNNFFDATVKRILSALLSISSDYIILFSYAITVIPIVSVSILSVAAQEMHARYGVSFPKIGSILELAAMNVLASDVTPLLTTFHNMKQARSEVPFSAFSPTGSSNPMSSPLSPNASDKTVTNSQKNRRKSQVSKTSKYTSLINQFTNTNKSMLMFSINLENLSIYNPIESICHIPPPILLGRFLGVTPDEISKKDTRFYYPKVKELISSRILIYFAALSVRWPVVFKELNASCTTEEIFNLSESIFKDCLISLQYASSSVLEARLTNIPDLFYDVLDYGVLNAVDNWAFVLATYIQVACAQFVYTNTADLYEGLYDTTPMSAENTTHVETGYVITSCVVLENIIDTPDDRYNDRIASSKDTLFRLVKGPPHVLLKLMLYSKFRSFCEANGLQYEEQTDCSQFDFLNSNDIAILKMVEEDVVKYADCGLRSLGIARCRCVIDPSQYGRKYSDLSDIVLRNTTDWEYLGLLTFDALPRNIHVSHKNDEEIIHIEHSNITVDALIKESSDVLYDLNRNCGILWKILSDKHYYTVHYLAMNVFDMCDVVATPYTMKLPFGELSWWHEWNALYNVDGFAELFALHKCEIVRQIACGSSGGDDWYADIFNRHSDDHGEANIVGLIGGDNLSDLSAFASSSVGISFSEFHDYTTVTNTPTIWNSMLSSTDFINTSAKINCNTIFTGLADVIIPIISNKSVENIDDAEDPLVLKQNVTVASQLPYIVQFSRMTVQRLHVIVMYIFTSVMWCGLLQAMLVIAYRGNSNDTLNPLPLFLILTSLVCGGLTGLLIVNYSETSVFAPSLQSDDAIDLSFGLVMEQKYSKGKSKGYSSVFESGKETSGSKFPVNVVNSIYFTVVIGFITSFTDAFITALSIILIFAVPGSVFYVNGVSDAWSWGVIGAIKRMCERFSDMNAILFFYISLNQLALFCSSYFGQNSVFEINIFKLVNLDSGGNRKRRVLTRGLVIGFSSISLIFILFRYIFTAGDEGVASASNATHNVQSFEYLILCVLLIGIITVIVIIQSIVVDFFRMLANRHIKTLFIGYLNSFTMYGIPKNSLQARKFVYGPSNFARCAEAVPMEEEDE